MLPHSLPSGPSAFTTTCGIVGGDEAITPARSTAATGQRPRASLHVATVGEPALGPSAFMHRPSARLLPIALIARAEVARKGELFETGDARHLDTFPMVRATVGSVFDVIDLPHARVHVGGALSSSAWLTSSTPSTAGTSRAC